MKIIPLSEGSFSIDASKKFIPYQASGEGHSHHHKGRMVVEVQPFLVISENDIILLDTGLGLTGQSGFLPVFSNLKQVGVKPEEVTKVLMSHLHKDHAGGLVNPYTQTPNFENAAYYIQKRELEYALEKGGPSYFTPDLEIIESSGKIISLDADEGVIDGYIQYQVTAAHSKFHQVFWIREHNEIAFFGGDDAPQYGQLKRKFVAKYDYNGQKAMQLRDEWKHKGKLEHWNYLFYHDTQKPVYKPG